MKKRRPRARASTGLYQDITKKYCKWIKRRKGEVQRQGACKQTGQGACKQTTDPCEGQHARSAASGPGANFLKVFSLFLPPFLITFWRCFLHFCILFRDLFLKIFFIIVPLFLISFFFGEPSRTPILLHESYAFRTCTFFEKLEFS